MATINPALAMPHSQNQQALLAQLRQLLGDPNVLVDDSARIAYESDALTAFQSQPLGVAIPETVDQVIDVVKMCHEHRIPFVARGSGTSLSGGSLPIADGIVIAVNRLNHIVDYRPADRVMTVQPGVINQTVSDTASKDGLYYAPDPSSGPVCTIGGNVAFNSGGAHCLKYGMTSNHVLAIKAVLPDGTVVNLGSDSWESSSADLPGIFVGSEGLFGIALEITLKLMVRPERYHTVLAAYDSVEKAGNAVSMIVASGLLPGAIEIMDRLAMDAAQAAVGVQYPNDAQSVLVVELEGTNESVSAEVPILDDLLLQSGSFQVFVAGNENERQQIWKGRKSAFSAVGRISPDYIVQDGVVPRSQLGRALREIAEIGKKHELRVANVFHAGDGNLHPLILFDGRVHGELERAEALAAEILQLCISLGGSITGEHGVGVEKLRFLQQMYSETEMDVFQRLRMSVDPDHLANRGKMLPSTAPALTHTGPHPLERDGVIFRE